MVCLGYACLVVEYVYILYYSLNPVTMFSVGPYAIYMLFVCVCCICIHVYLIVMKNIKSFNRKRFWCYLTPFLDLFLGFIIRNQSFRWSFHPLIFDWIIYVSVTERKLKLFRERLKLFRRRKGSEILRTRKRSKLLRRRKSLNLLRKEKKDRCIQNKKIKIQVF